MIGMKYDDASWHYGGDFSEDLPDAAGGTHIGMFVTWAILRGLAGSIHLEDFPDMLDKIRMKTMSPGEWFLAACDEKFTDQDLNEDGNAFSSLYHTSDASDSGYLADYASTFAEIETLYEVPDTWASFGRLESILDFRFGQWKALNHPA